MKPPAWFGEALVLAQHQDRLRSWPAWARWLHVTFIAWRCPACLAWRRGKA